MNRVAYVGHDGAVYIVDPDGEDRQMLLGNLSAQATPTVTGNDTQAKASIFHIWPTWSQDGRKLAVTRVTVHRPAGLEAEIFSVDTGSGDATKLYQDPPNVLPLIADDTPHYLYWSSDGQILTFIAQTSRGLTLHASPVETPDERIMLGAGGPLYWAWASNSRSLLVHAGEELFVFDLTDPDGLHELGDGFSGFRTPAWSPGGGRMAYIRQTDDGVALFQAQADGQNPQAVTNVGDDTAFLWSPTQDRIALATSHDTSIPFYEGLKLVELGSGVERTLTEERVAAFFWSPNGERIAYVSVEPESSTMSWRVMDPDTGQSRKLANFRPSSETFIHLFFFDQYAYSHSVWSPDSQSLVFAGSLAADDDVEVEDSAGGQVYVMDVDNPEGIEAIAEGFLAFWSWN